MYGSLSQMIDATPWRGKKIKLDAAIRTGVSGPGNQAYLWLRITKKLFGPAALLFYDNMADRRMNESPKTNGMHVIVSWNFLLKFCQNRHIISYIRMLN
jgi:hypothetical protein